MMPKARPVRLALAAALLLVLVLGAGVGWLRTRHTGQGPVKTTASAPRVRYAGAVTIVWPGGWPNPGWPLAPGLYSGNLWDALVDYRPDGSFFPELATQVPSPANGGMRFVKGQEVITFHLKPDLRWSDGSPITAADYLALPLVGSAPEIQAFGPAGNSYCPFHTVRFSGSTLVITLDGVYPEALETCGFTPAPWEYYQRKYHITVPAGLTASFDAGRVAAMYAAPAYHGSALQRLIAKLFNDPYTSPSDLFNGPYRMASWSRDGSGVEAPNRYFTALPPDPHHPRPATIRDVTLPGDVTTGVRAIIRGAIPADADMAFIGVGILPDLSPPPVLQAHPPYQLMVLTNTTNDFLVLNQENPALRDRRVRQALLYAIDKIAYLRRLFNLSAAQAAAIADTAPFAHLMRFSIADQLPANLYNPAKARALLAAAGYATSPTGPGRRLHLDLYTTTAPERERGEVILQRMWRQVGITVTLHFDNLQSSGGLFSSYGSGGIMARGAFAMAEMGWTPNRDPGFTYYAAFDPGNIPDQNHPDGANYGHVRDRTLFSLLNQAQDSLVDARRQQLYAQVQHYMVDQAYWIMLYDLPDPIWVKPTIGNFNPYGGNFNPYGSYVDFFWNSYEWYVK